MSSSPSTCTSHQLTGSKIAICLRLFLDQESPLFYQQRKINIKNLKPTEHRMTRALSVTKSRKFTLIVADVSDPYDPFPFEIFLSLSLLLVLTMMCSDA